MQDDKRAKLHGSPLVSEAIGAELGAPPSMLVVGQLCASEVGSLFLPCPGGQACTGTINTLPDEYRMCR